MFFKPAVRATAPVVLSQRSTIAAPSDEQSLLLASTRTDRPGEPALIAPLPRNNAPTVGDTYSDIDTSFDDLRFERLI